MIPVATIKKYKLNFLVICLSFLAALTYNELNLHFIKIEKPEKVRGLETIKTADDASYLTPSHNFFEGKGWRDNSIGISSYFIRPPGYGLLYGSLYYFTGENNALTALKYVQLLLFALSASCIFSILIRILSSPKIALIISLFYGITPFASGFLYYTLSEGITPALVIFYAYFLVLAKTSEDESLKNKYYLCTSLILSYLIIVRPVLAILGIVFPVFLILDFHNKITYLKLAKKLAIYGSFSFLLLGIWQIRNFKLTGKVPSIYPIYHPEFNSVFRPTHEKIWEFGKCWGIVSEDFHQTINPIWEAGMKGDTSTKHLTVFLNQIPVEMTEELGIKNIQDAFISYQRSLLTQKKYLDQKSPMPGITEHEKITIQKFDNLIKEYKKNHWFRFHFVISFKYFTDIVFHSNLSLHIFQHTFRGNWLMEALRIIFFAIHCILFFMVFINMFFIQDFSYKTAFNLSCLVYILFLVLLYRVLEERYTLPILPLLLIGSGITLKYLIDTLRKTKD